jgi:hypothetical protein
MEQKHPTFPKTKNSDPRPLQVKWCSSLWEGNEPITEHYLQQGTTTVSYTEISQSKLKSEGFFCSTITHVCILQQLPLKQTCSWNMSISHAPIYSSAWCISGLDQNGSLDHKACELLYNTHLKKGVIMLGKDTLCICYRLLYTKY